MWYRGLQLIIIGLFVAGAVAVPSPAWAVVSGEVVITEKAQAVGEATLTFVDDKGNEVGKSKEETDDRGGVLIVFDDDARGKTVTVVVTKKDGTRTEVPGFVVPQQNWGQYQVDIASGAISLTKLAAMAPVSPALSESAPKDADSGGVTVIGQDNEYKDFQKLMISLTYGHSFGSVGTEVTQNNTKNAGQDIDVSTPSIRADVRFFPFAPGNMGNVANVGNIGNIGNMGLLGWYFGVQGAIGLGGGDTGLKLDLHGGDGQVDTILMREFRGSITPYVGFPVFEFPNQNGYLNVHAGPRISFVDYTFDTDETQGGGNFQRLEKSRTAIGAAFGAEYNLPLDPEYYGGLQGGFQVGAWGEYMPGHEFSTTTQPFNIDYKIKSDSAFIGTFRIGGFLQF